MREDLDKLDTLFKDNELISYEVWKRVQSVAKLYPRSLTSELDTEGLLMLCICHAHRYEGRLAYKVRNLESESECKQRSLDEYEQRELYRRYEALCSEISVKYLSKDYDLTISQAAYLLASVLHSKRQFEGDSKDLIPEDCTALRDENNLVTPESYEFIKSISNGEGMYDLNEFCMRAFNAGLKKRLDSNYMWQLWGFYLDELTKSKRFELP